MANVDMDRGDRIADLRKKHGWSQDEFADRVGIGPRYKGWLLQAKTAASAKAAKAIIMSAEKDSVQSYISHRINTDSVTYVKVQ